jgi:ssDNA-binding Zn-finger/Zn-ribbon topoisomerase 1
MGLRFSKKYGQHFYGCENYPECKGSHSAHPDGNPTGVPGDKVTRTCRSECHALFDPLWKQGLLARRNAYRLLAKLVGLSTEDAHIGLFTIEQCTKFKEQFALWKGRKNPDFEFYHLYTSDLRTILKDTKRNGDGPWPVEVLVAEIARREAAHAEMDQERVTVGDNAQKRYNRKRGNSKQRRNRRTNQA